MLFRELFYLVHIDALVGDAPNVRPANHFPD
jgi:hypothetical protein